MPTLLRIASRVLLAAAVLAGGAVVVLYTLAFAGLPVSGPTAGGYDLLNAANRSVPWVAALAVVTVGAASVTRSSWVPASVLALASGVVGGLCVGAGSLAVFLSHVGQHAQPPALNSYVLAVAGSAQDIAPAAVVLAVGAVALGAVRVVAVARTRSRITSPAVAAVA
jgi:hypothetical protein